MLPVVLHHGLMGLTGVRIAGFNLSYFRNIDRVIADRANPLITPSVHPTGSIALRARQLKTQILRELKKNKIPTTQKLIIIAHSMGGLDSRYMISKLGMDDRVAALLTVCTPHRGSPYADWCLLNLGKRLGGLRLMKLLNLDVQALTDLTTDHCKKFNEQVPDAPDVRYFSISAARPWNKVPPFALHAWRIIQSAEGDNDSLVSVQSSTWGEHLGVWPADHWHSINHRYSLDLKNPTGNIAPYYLKALNQVLTRISSPLPGGERQAEG
jgi:triacylglycerol lipase